MNNTVTRALGFISRHKRAASGAALVLAVVLVFALVNSPAVVGVSATRRSLPVYSVERDGKFVALSFDAAWGDVRQRRRSSEAGTLGKAAKPLFRESTHAGGTRFHAEKSSRLA